jgi:hypothetical protein
MHGGEERERRYENLFKKLPSRVAERDLWKGDTFNRSHQLQDVQRVGRQVVILLDEEFVALVMLQFGNVIKDKVGLPPPVVLHRDEFALAEREEDENVFFGVRAIRYAA